MLAGSGRGPARSLLRTSRLMLVPIRWDDLADLQFLKTDPGAYAMMLGGIRRLPQVADELAEDLAFWADMGTGMFIVRETGRFQGMAGVHHRPDGLGVGLRFCLWPAARGRGLAREAASAALQHAHASGLARVIAVARADNFSSRTVLGCIGMHEQEFFERDGHRMLVYESLR